MTNEETIEQIATAGTVSESLEESTYQITRPVVPDADWGGTGTIDSPSVTIDIDAPPRGTPTRGLSATQYAKLQGDNDHVHHTAEDGREGTQGDTEVAESATGLKATTLGSVVHRLCERRPPRSRWEEYVRDVAEREEASIDHGDVTRAIEHAERATTFVDEYEAELTVESTYEELSVAARFDEGQVVGDIDHLVVTPDTYHIIDYKTNDTTKQSVDLLAEDYWSQLGVYAVALSQADPHRDTEAVLYFSDAAEARYHSFDDADIEEISDQLRTALSETHHT